MASELAAALAKVQAELPHIAKGETADVKNKEGRKLYDYKYADLTAVSDVLLPLLGKHGLAFTAWPTLDDDRFVLAYALLHEGGEERTGVYPLPSSGTPQAIGSAITYARRYCLCAVTGVAPGGDDNDAAGAGEVNMDRPARRGPERYTGWDRPGETPVPGPRPGPDHERLRQEPPPSGSVWDGEDHWVDQPPGQLNGTTPKPAQRGRKPLSPAQAIHVHLKRLGVPDDTDQLVKATILAGRSELLEHVSDLDEAKQQEISAQLAKLKDRAALDRLVDAKRAEASS